VKKRNCIVGEGINSEPGQSSNPEQENLSMQLLESSSVGRKRDASWLCSRGMIGLNQMSIISKGRKCGHVRMCQKEKKQAVRIRTPLSF
jgi:hypothetical protein